MRFRIFFVLILAFSLLYLNTLSVTAQATIIVDTANDSNAAADGECSLREAIANANGNSDTTSGDCVAGSATDTIEFNIAGAGPHTISLGTGLPSITERINIDGLTQTGADCQTGLMIVINGAATPASSGLSLQSGASNSTIRGLVIQGFASGNAIALNDADSTSIQCNFLGTDSTGASAVGNFIGIFVQGTANNNIIGTDGNGANDVDERNLLSGNVAGIVLSGSSVTGNTVAGNYIGTDETGTSAIGNTAAGIFVQGGANNNLIGTNGDGNSDTEERNLISGNNGGIALADADNNRIAGNFIGTRLDGLAALSNSGIGITIQNVATGNVIGVDLGSAGDANEGNLISGNGAIGIAISNDSPTNRIAGNFIGTSATGTFAIANATGIFIGSANNTIGGTNSLEGNLISGNSSDGIEIGLATATGNDVLGNIIGLQIDGSSVLGNGFNGIHISNSATNNNIGGTSFIGANLIGRNALAGILIDGTNTANNTIRYNYIGTDSLWTNLANGLIGIEISATGTGTTTVNNNWIFYHPSTGIFLSNAGSLGAAGASEQNCLYLNTAGVNNSTGSNTFFENNWWGAPSGPSGVGTGSGDSVTANVDYISFLTVAPIGCPGLVTVTATDPDAAENPLDTGTFTFNLGFTNSTGAPITINYTITGTATNSSDYSTIAASIAIPNGASGITLPLSPINDAIVELAETVIITLTGTSNPLLFVDTTPATVTIVDDDVAGVTIDPLAVSSVEGGTTTYTVVLDSQPNTGEIVTVTVAISGAAAGEIASTSPATLTFNFDDTNWNIPQSFDITLADNLIVDGNRSYTAAFTHSSDSTDAASPYDATAALVIDSVDLNVVDNETPNVLINPTAFGLLIGNSRAYDVSLTVEPASDVTITLTQLDANCTISTTTLTFTNSAGATPWNVPQQVTVTAVGAHLSTCTIQHTPTGGGYTGVLASDVVVNIRRGNIPSSPTTGAEPEIALFDPAISKLGLLLPGQTGIIGEELEWLVTVSNVGTVAGTNVTVTDTLIPALQIDSVDAPGATITISGQTVTVVYPTLAVGQTVQFSIFTTVLQGVSINNTACVNATNQGAQECATALPVSQLPSTGESPLWRYVVLTGIAGLLFALGMLGIKLKRRV